MSTPIRAQITGSFTSDGTIRNISLPSGYDIFEMINITDIGSTAAATPVMRATGTSLMSSGSAYYSTKTNGAATLDIESTTASGGFTFVSDSASTANGSSISLNGTEINQASPAVASSATTTGLVDGSSVVRLSGTTGMLQVSGMDFTVGTIVGGTSFQLKYLDSTQTGFGANATAGNYIQINADPRFYPRRRFITKIASSGLSTVVTMSVTHQFTIGQAVRLLIPSGWGMTALNGRIGTVTAISTANNTITLNIDSSSAGAFSWPTSAVAAAGVGFAQVVPVGEAATTSAGVVNPANLLDDATDNQSFTGISIGTTVQTTDKLYQWIASKGVTLA